MNAYLIHSYLLIINGCRIIQEFSDSNDPAFSSCLTSVNKVNALKATSYTIKKYDENYIMASDYI